MTAYTDDRSGVAQVTAPGETPPTEHRGAYARRPILFLLGWLAVACLAASLTTLTLLRPPLDETLTLVSYLALSGLASLALGYAGATLLRRSGIGGIRVRIAFGVVLVVAVAFVNVVATALLMFLSPHDLGLLGLLLLFAGLLAVAVAVAIADAIVHGIGEVARAARRISTGDLRTRVAIEGRDEVAALAHTFNSLAEQLDEAARQRAEAEAARRRLIAAISHDLRTPLASIRAMIEAINDGIVTDEATIRRYLATTQRETERLADLIADLFEMSQIDAGSVRLRVEDGSVHDLISDTLRGFQARAERAGVTLTGAVPPDLPPTPFDQARIQRVLDNLVGNALRHTPVGGTVTIAALATDDAIAIEVRDSGEGIDPADRERVFEAFYRGDAARSRGAGAGLGLTIARAIVQGHGGTIAIASVRGEGTTVRLTLPLAGTADARAVEARI